VPSIQKDEAFLLGIGTITTVFVLIGLIVLICWLLCNPSPT
jgi:hypothetical protein